MRAFNIGVTSFCEKIDGYLPYNASFDPAIVHSRHIPVQEHGIFIGTMFFVLQCKLCRRAG
jgi:hypothetical protein